MLSSAGIERLIDIRRYPVSRRYPHFTRESLQAWLGSVGVRYQWEGVALGGRRSAGADTPHSSLRDTGLHGFAGHMEGETFTHRLREIMSAAAGERVAFMCAERLPEHCHRSLVADYLMWRGCRVFHLLDAERAREHSMHPCARVIDDRLVYNGGMTIPFDLQ